MVFLEISQNSQENTYARASFLIKLQPGLRLQATPQAAASEIDKLIFPLKSSGNWCFSQLWEVLFLGLFNPFINQPIVAYHTDATLISSAYQMTSFYNYKIQHQGFTHTLFATTVFHLRLSLSTMIFN